MGRLNFMKIDWLRNDCFCFISVHPVLPGESIKTSRRLKKSCSLNIKAMMLKTVLFYPRYVKLGSVIYPALIGHSIPSK